MDLRQLRYFKTIIEEGTITGAARKLHISQPPLSSQMHLLEKELGTLLFERGARQVVLRKREAVSTAMPWKCWIWKRRPGRKSVH